mmetsp:Transcript_3414/g.5803  ORF Transcript_3414/g.5803 Transcript_3414/m.5803 type:complete len:80 (+) Transcript_3414:941-1180(+)
MPVFPAIVNETADEARLFNAAFTTMMLSIYLDLYNRSDQSGIGYSCNCAMQPSDVCTLHSRFLILKKEASVSPQSSFLT